MFSIQLGEKNKKNKTLALKYVSESPAERCPPTKKKQKQNTAQDSAAETETDLDSSSCNRS